MVTDHAPPSPPAERTSQRDRFVSILNNKQKDARLHLDRRVRTRGFVVLARKTQHLDAVQQWCVEQVWNHECVALRYRIQDGPVLGTLLAAALRDLRAMQRRGVSSRDDLSGSVRTRTEASDGQPRLAGPDGHDEIARLVADKEGTLAGAHVAALLEDLEQIAAYAVGHRLVLLAEVTGAPDHVEWETVALPLFAHLPERMGIVIAGAPESFTLPSDEHHLVLELADVDGAPVPEEAVYEPGRFSSDQPTADDRLGVRRYAQALAQFVMHPETSPVTIAVQGAWGKGKSSFMLLVQQALVETALEPVPLDLVRGIGWWQRRRIRRAVNRRVVIVDFNAWSYQDAGQVWAGLAQACTRAIEGALPLRRRLTTPLAYAWRNRRADLLIDVVLPAIVAGLVLALAAVGAPALQTELEDANASERVTRLLGGVLPWSASLLTAFWIVASRAQRVIGPFSRRVMTYTKRRDYAAQMGEQHRVRTELKFLIKRLRGSDPDPRIVVFVDDLDRCSDDTVVEVLQATNLIVGASDCYVFFGIDAEMIYRAIEAHYGADGRPLKPRFAERYLEKIVQLPFNLPEASREQRADFVASLFSDAARQEASTPGGDASGSPKVLPPELDWNHAHLQTPELYLPRPVPDTGTELRAFLEFQARLDDNPRELKRLVNVHRFVKIVLARQGRPATEDMQRKLVMWLMFCARWPDLYPDVLKYARDHAGCADCIAALDLGDAGAKAFPGDVALTATDLADEGPLALAASISQSVQWRTAGAPEA